MEVVYYMDDRGYAPVLNWIKKLDRDAQVQCGVKIDRLGEFGHKLDRPDCAYLGEKIYELRITSNRQRYRILYFFHDRKAIVLSHAFLKKAKKVPKRELRKAVSRKEKFEMNPPNHMYGV